MLRIRPFSLSDLDSILKIENQSFPKSPYNWTTFLNLHSLYPETFLVYANPPPEGLDSAHDLSSGRRLRGNPERCSPTPPLKAGLGAAEWVNINRSLKEDILGYIIFSRDGHIISIAVNPLHRRKGIGRQLLQRAMETPHLKKVWAEVRKSNQGAQAFYSKMGFRMTGVVPNYYGNEDALIIQWTPAIRASY